MSAEAPKEGQYHYDKYALGQRPVAPVIERVYESFTQLPQNSWVLDLGSGPGRFALNAPKPRPFRVLGVDQSPVAIAQFSRAISLDGKMDEGWVGDITNLSLPQGREFRGAVSWRVLHCLEPEQQVQVLDQLGRILPDQAPVFLAIASTQDWKAKELEAKGLYKPGTVHNCQEIMRLDEPFGIDFFTDGRVEDLAKKAGFRVVEIEAFEEPTGFEHLKGDHPNNSYLYAHLVRA